LLPNQRGFTRSSCAKEKKPFVFKGLRALSFRGKWYSKGVGLIDAAMVVAAEQLDVKVWAIDKNFAKILKYKRRLWEL